MSEVLPESDPSGPTLYVGQDVAGHWLVQDSDKRMEGRFVSFAAAMQYAQGERHAYRAAVVVAIEPLRPLVAFVPVAPSERALPRAA
ncbi:hypothetical protein [Sphingomonas sp. 1185]|uniref:hypothetical protein n=1 Tax=Sphingomonas sp. 1185 TaxID=3156411 RepID=UPI00339667B6